MGLPVATLPPMLATFLICFPANHRSWPAIAFSVRASKAGRAAQA